MIGVSVTGKYHLSKMKGSPDQDKEERKKATDGQLAESNAGRLPARGGVEDAPNRLAPLEEIGGEKPG